VKNVQIPYSKNKVVEDPELEFRNHLSTGKIMKTDTNITAIQVNMDY
jgi:hypothetical protein